MASFFKYGWLVAAFALLGNIGVLGPGDAEAKRKKERPAKVAKAKRGKKGRKKAKGRRGGAANYRENDQEKFPEPVHDELPHVGAEAGPDPRRLTLRTDKIHGELRKHLSRIAKINRIEEIARAKGKDTLLAKANMLRAMEQKRHAAVTMLLGGSAPSGEAN